MTEQYRTAGIGCCEHYLPNNTCRLKLFRRKKKNEIIVCGTPCPKVK